MVVGFIGVVIISLVFGLLIFFDVIFMMYFFYEVLNKVNVYKERKIFYCEMKFV